MATEHGEAKPKTFSLVRVGLAVGLVVALLYGFSALDRYSRRIDAEETLQSVEAESFALLDAAQGEDELRDAVGYLGHLFSLPQGEYVAIRYLDSHGWPGWSSAVAVDSGGNWWVSDEHFCGRFKIFRQQLENVTNAKVEQEREYQLDRLESYPELNLLQNAPSLEAAQVKLRQLGFNAASPP